MTVRVFQCCVVCGDWDGFIGCGAVVTGDDQVPTRCLHEDRECDWVEVTP